jgi:hypothetical protein
VVAKKCGVTEKNQDLDNLTLQQYLEMYKQPLTEHSIEAITKLSEVVEGKKKKKNGKKAAGVFGTASKAAGKKMKNKMTHKESALRHEEA